MQTPRIDSPPSTTVLSQDMDLLPLIATARAISTAILSSLPPVSEGAPPKPTVDSYRGPHTAPSRMPRLANFVGMNRIGASVVSSLSSLAGGVAAALKMSPVASQDARRLHAEGYFASVDAWRDTLRRDHGAITDQHLEPLWPFLDKLRTRRELAATWEAIKPLRDAINERGLETIGCTSKINLRGWQLEAKLFEIPAGVQAAIEAGR